MNAVKLDKFFSDADDCGPFLFCIVTVRYYYIVLRLFLISINDKSKKEIFLFSLLNLLLLDLLKLIGDAERQKIFLDKELLEVAYKKNVNIVAKQIVYTLQ